MMVVSILTRRLKPGKTYDDFRKAWYHTVGFGAPIRLYSAINALDQREIIVFGLGEIGPGQDPMTLIHTDVEQRLEHPLDAVIEPQIGRTFGIVVAEDDFSPTGKMEYKPAAVNGRPTDFGEVSQALELARTVLAEGMKEREKARRAGRRNRSGKRRGSSKG